MSDEQVTGPVVTSTGLTTSVTPAEGELTMPPDAAKAASFTPEYDHGHSVGKAVGRCEFAREVYQIIDAGGDPHAIARQIEELCRGAIPSPVSNEPVTSDFGAQS